MLLSIVSGIFVGTSYIPFPPWALFFGFVPLWITWQNQTSWKRIFLFGWITQFILTLIGFHWVAYTAKEFGLLPWPLAALVLLAFCSLAHLHIPIAGVIWHILTRKRELPLFARIATLVCCAGLVEQFYPMIFPWNLGYPWLWAGIDGYQWADVVGFTGLSQITLAVNGVLTWAVLERAKKWQVMGTLAATAAALGAMIWTGPSHGEPWRTTDSQVTFRVIQANIGNLEKHFAQAGRGFRSEIVEDYLKLARQPSEGPYDLMLWPETAFPDAIETISPNAPHWIKLQSFLRDTGTTLLTGAYSQSADRQKEYNGFFAIPPDGWPLHTAYRKSILLAFGEYFPGGELFPFLYQLVPTISKFGRGDGPTIQDVKGTKLGPQICYEGLYPDFTRGLANQGAQVLVNVTNDSWFGRDMEPYQHLYMTLARAIEVRRPLVRATNTGVSTAITAYGDIGLLSPVLQPWAGNITVPYLKAAPQTFFARWGEWLGWVLLAVLILLVQGPFRVKK
jgi:apolipoprotein N-acyltransferase